jgi:hypothetical protein
MLDFLPGHSSLSFQSKVSNTLQWRLPRCIVVCSAGVPVVAAQIASAPPTISLLGDPIITIMSGELFAYTLCAPDSPQDLVCDPGVKSAIDDLDGDLLAAGAVTACSNSSTLAKAGLAACSMVVKPNIPGEYTVEFGVRDSEVCALFLCPSSEFYNAAMHC